MSRILGRDDILGADDLERRTIDVPEWGGSVLVQEMTGATREQFEETCVSTNGTDPAENVDNLRANLLTFTVIDESGNLLFTRKDVDALAGKSGRALVRVCAEVYEMNGIGDEEVQAIVEDFGEGPSDGSATD